MSTAKAQKRLHKAFDRLESAARALKDRAQGDGAGAGSDPGSDPGSDNAALDALRAERDRLAGELETMRKDHAALEQVTETASTRIDAAVARLKSTLGA